MSDITGHISDANCFRHGNSGMSRGREFRQGICGAGNFGREFAGQGISAIEACGGVGLGQLSIFC